MNFEKVKSFEGGILTPIFHSTSKDELGVFDRGSTTRAEFHVIGMGLEVDFSEHIIRKMKSEIPRYSS